MSIKYALHSYLLALCRPLLLLVIQIDMLNLACGACKCAHCKTERLDMATGAKKELDRLMGRNLKRLRLEHSWSQEYLAELIDSDRRYISALENGRGMGNGVLMKLCAVFQVSEGSFTQMSAAESGELYGKLSNVMRMLLEELQALPEYEQLRLLADIKERKVKG